MSGSLPGRQIRPSGVHAVRVASVVNINEVLDSHVSLQVDCVGRLYLNAYVPEVAGRRSGGDLSQRPSRVSGAVTVVDGEDRQPVPAGGEGFRGSQAHPGPGIEEAGSHACWDDPRLDHVRPYLDAAELCQPSQLRQPPNLAPAGSSSKVSGETAWFGGLADRFVRESGCLIAAIPPIPVAYSVMNPVAQGEGLPPGSDPSPRAAIKRQRLSGGT